MVLLPSINYGCVLGTGRRRDEELMFDGYGV